MSDVCALTVNRVCLQPRMEYTEAQVQDLLHLRRLYYGKLGQLYRQRKELRSQVPLACMGEVEGICATDNYTLLSSLADKLRVNAAEECPAPGPAHPGPTLALCMSHVVCTNLHCRSFARLGSAGFITQSALTGLAEQNLVCRRHAYCQAKRKYRVCGHAYRAMQVNMLMAVRFTHADYCLLFRFKPADRGQSPWYMPTPMWPTKTRL